jgi:hypothetical protein
MEKDMEKEGMMKSEEDMKKTMKTKMTGSAANGVGRMEKSKMYQEQHKKEK